MYDYKAERAAIFTEKGQVMFLQVRDAVERLLKIAGCVRMDKAIQSVSGDAWQMLACVDRLVELKEIREVTCGVAGQDRIFVSTKD